MRITVWLQFVLSRLDGCDGVFTTSAFVGNGSTAAFGSVEIFSAVLTTTLFD